jgi:hypothetical protein
MMRVNYGMCLVSVLLVGCSLESWNPAKVGYEDTATGCPRYQHTVRGPDQYDIDHGRPHHCEVPMHDPDFADIDQVDQ